MTATETTNPATDRAAWDAEFQKLQARYPGTKDSILFCIHALQQNDAIALDDLKAQAKVHGIRITAASLSAARRQMANGNVENRPTTPTRAKPATNDHGTETEALIRQVLTKVQNQHNAEAEKLRAVIRKAIAMLEGVLR